MKKLLLSLLLVGSIAQAQTFPVNNLTASGWIRNAAGAAATPTYSFTGATTTGLFWANPGIGFSVAGASAGSILSTGWNGAVVATTLSASTPIPITSGGTGNTTGTATVNANLTGVITSVGNATSIASQTGTGTTFVTQTSPTLITPNLGTPSAGVATNLTGTATALNIGGTAARATNIAGGAAGSLPYQTGANTTTFLAPGANTNVLTLTGGVPTWAAPTTGFANPMTTLGDTIIGGASGSPARLGIGTTGQLYSVVSGSPAWSSTINGVSIGATTPSTGAFTALTASGNTTLSPTGSVTINPSVASTINNTSIGATTASTVRGTSLTATTGAILPSYPTGITGNVSGAGVSGGAIGEIVTSTVTGANLTSATPMAVTSISLTAGMWEIAASTYFLAGGSTTSTLFAAGISANGSLPAIPLYSILQGTYPASASQGLPTPLLRVNISTPTTYYCVMQANFSVSTMTPTCKIEAKRF